MKKYVSFLATLVALIMCSAGSEAQSYEFINYDANHIILNGDNWSSLRKALANPKALPNGKFQVVHLGDSHIQPGIMTQQVRHAMQKKWGNGGRGLIAPLSMAKTNEPSDYVFKSDLRPADYNKLVARRWTTDVGVTGVAIRWRGSSTSLQLRAKLQGDEFSHVTLLHAPKGGYDYAVVGRDTLEGEQLSKWATRFDLKGRVAAVNLSTNCSSDLNGAILSNDRPGVMVHAIGNNGATYQSYLKVPDFSKQLQALDPQLVIISMGTNEAFGNSVASVENHIHRLVSAIKKDNPKAHILLTTPMECHKKSGNGYVVNPQVKQVRDIIMDYGKRHKVAVWDLYTVAGGDGASYHWLDAKLMNGRDHLHNLNAGYEVLGNLLAKALMGALTGK